MTASMNVDLVRSIHEGWDRGNFSSTDWAHPEIEYVVADGPEPGSWTGVVGMAEGFRHFLNVWDDLRVEAQGFRELDDGRVLVLVHVSGRGKTSGMELGQVASEKGARLWHVRDGKVTRLVVYVNRERALADVGLAPEGETT